MISSHNSVYERVSLEYKHKFPLSFNQGAASIYKEPSQSYNLLKSRYSLILLD